MAIDAMAWGYGAKGNTTSTMAYPTMAGQGLTLTLWAAGRLRGVRPRGSGGGVGQNKLLSCK
jgi:hypothetical protein